MRKTAPRTRELDLRRPSARSGCVRRWMAAVLRWASVCGCALGVAAWTTEVTPGKAKPKPPAAARQAPAKPAAAPADRPLDLGPSAIPPVPQMPTLTLDPDAGRSAPAESTPAAAAPSRGPGRRLPKVAGGAVALAAALEGDASGTALVLTLTRAAQFATFTLSDPDRVVVDLQDVDFRVPPAVGAAGQGLVKSYRYGLLAAGKSRIVIDVASPVRIEKADIVALRGADTVQLRVALVPTSAAEFKAAAVGGRAAPQTSPSPPGALAGSAANGKARKSGRPVIVLDPGHGGLDAGTLGSTTVAEKDVVLRFAKLLRDKLRATGKFDVHLTREVDMFVKLDDRVRMAREHGCDLFISLHTDSVPPQYAHLNVRGATIYTISQHDADAGAQKLAEKENLSDVIAGVESLHDEEQEVAGILTDLMRRETTTTSHAFTGTLLDYMRKSTGLSREPHRNAAFRVLRAPDMPSVLVELGFLSNREDEKLLVSRDWQDQVAGSIGRAVETFFEKRIARTPY